MTEPTGNHSTIPLYRSETLRTFRSTVHRRTNANFGGFPGPRQILSRLIRRFFPGVHRQLTRTLTIPRTTTITSMQGNMERARAVPYISFDAVVGHNSSFEELTEEQLEELGGVEFRALNALLWIVGIVGSGACFCTTGLTHFSTQYHIFVQLACFIIIAPYMSLDKWKNDFRRPQQKRPIIPAWYVSFIGTNTLNSTHFPQLPGFHSFRSCLRTRTQECPSWINLWCPFKERIL